MCKYCENGIEKRINGKYGSIRLTITKGRLSIQTYNDGLIIYYPKYCPECGRKLKMEGDEE